MSDDDWLKAAAPFVDAYATWASEYLAAALLGADWDKAEAAEEPMRDAFFHFMAASAQSRSGAATELEFYGEAS